jgi:hypothetical protein
MTEGEKDLFSRPVECVCGQCVPGRVPNANLGIRIVIRYGRTPFGKIHDLHSNDKYFKKISEEGILLTSSTCALPMIET